MKNILLALDFTALSQRMIAISADLATKYGAKLWIVHVAAPDPDFVGYEAGPQSVREHRAKELRDEHRKLQAHAEALNQRGVEAEAFLIQGATVETIFEKVESYQAELIVVGAHEHSWLYEKFFGSMWPRIVHNSKVPVLIVPETDHK